MIIPNIEPAIQKPLPPWSLERREGNTIKYGMYRAPIKNSERLYIINEIKFDSPECAMY